MSTHLFVLGNHRALSVAELFMRYQEGHFQHLGADWAIMDLPMDMDQTEFNALGGCVKVGRVIESAEGGAVNTILASALADRDTGSKIDYGVSVYGMPEMNLRPLLLNLKKTLRNADIKSRFINNNFQNITAAQYKSIRSKGVEFLVAKEGNRTWVAETTGVQDIDAYSQRDYGKPFRDMKMGMLPPKLAQILINLTGVDGRIWDPFCGSGALVMEGLLMGHPMVGSDIHAERVEGARKNIDWLKKEFGVKAEADLQVHDATRPFSKPFDAIAAETDLGMPHSQHIRPELLKKVMEELDDLYVRVFENLKAMKCDKPIVLALPYFRSADGREQDMGQTLLTIHGMGFARTPLLPENLQMGDRFRLKYSRPDQAVGRAIYRFVLG
jgi:Putative RNA methylase family UPF0020